MRVPAACKVGAIVRVRILVALSVCLAARAALAAACNGGSCPAANLIVSNIVSPQSAGTVSSVRVEARTSNGTTATLYAGKIHFTSTDPTAALPADYTFTSADQGVHAFTNGVVLKTAGTQSVTATDTKTATIKGSQTGIIENGSDSPLAIATDTNGCTDSDPSKMLLLGHNLITLSAQFGVDEIAVFDPAQPCKRIGATTVHRRQSD